MGTYYSCMNKHEERKFAKVKYDIKIPCDISSATEFCETHEDYKGILHIRANSMNEVVGSLLYCEECDTAPNIEHIKTVYEKGIVHV